MLLSITRIFWCVAMTSVVVSTSACAVEDCTFSEEIISENRYSANKSIEIYQWFPKSNEVKGVLTNGNLFSVKHWSCNHYGKHAIMIMGPQMKSIPNELNDQVLYLGQIALSDAELGLLASAIEGKPLRLADTPVEIGVAADEFDKFNVRINIVGESIFIEIKLYKS